ncbi:hypothetical protein F511_09348 [Dorcoceras hygrometricum]|uniref:Uncharacterized protein n=1 Tax=Dorcoceras hygrometricum TaxID=472368 RepID=A0A2Z7C3V8_9LAMI|nr:hypothetical protein F511_09348 [Dorcoceras hygrometricum]
MQIPNTQQHGASPGLVRIINITGTHGKGDRLAESPLCPAWIPEDPANGSKTHNINHSMFTPKAAKGCSSLMSQKGTADSRPATSFLLALLMRGRRPGLNTSSTKQRGMLTQKLKPARKTHITDFSKSFEHQQLRASTPALLQGSKWVAIERAKLGEYNATKIIKYRGWKRRESAMESYGEQ